MTQTPRRSAYVCVIVASALVADRVLQTEFEETIIEDLALLDIKSEVVTHTSDYFDQLYELAVKIIKEGKAYADDTEQMQVSHTSFPRPYSS